jgi:5-methylthioadenosine/S-adenosylhomocysteine deaminase
MEAPNDVDLLVRGGTVVTMDAERRVLHRGHVAVRGTRIVEVGGDDATLTATTTIDATGKVVFPGLVNTHTHLFQTLLKGLGDDRVLVDWFGCMTGPSASALTERDCYTAALCGALEALRFGTTCIKDFMYAHPRPHLTDAVARGLVDSGIRAVLVRGYCDWDDEDNVPPPLIEPLEAVLADCERVAAAYHGAEDGRLSVRFGPCMIWSVTPESLREVRALATDLAVGLTMHISETQHELAVSRRRFGRTDVQYLAETGFLGPDVLAVHCVHLDRDDIRTIRDHDVRVSHNPTSNMFLASGVAPVPDMLATGITVGLGCDGPASNNNHNMVEALKFAALLHKVRRDDPTAITAEQSLEMATIGGARALGLDHEIGSLEPGKKADIVVADLATSLAAAPIHHPVSSLVYSATGHEIDTVIVDGHVTVDGGEFVAIDAASVLRETQAAADNLVERAGTGWLRHRPWRSYAASMPAR